MIPEPNVENHTRKFRTSIFDPRLKNSRIVKLTGKGMTIYQFIRVVICLNLIMITLAVPTTASACSCVEPRFPSQAFQKSNAVFTGTVLRIVDEYDPIFSTLDRVLTAIGKQPYFWVRSGKYVGYRVYFHVHQSWKGVEKSNVMIDTGYGMGDCGYSFTLSNDYLVYASYPYGIPDNYWVTSICSRNAEISAATTDLRYLSTLPTLSLSSSMQIFGLPIGTVAVWVVLILTATVIFLSTQRPPTL